MTPIEIPKGKLKALRLTVSEYQGRMLLNARIWWRKDEADEFKPGKEGWAVAVERLPELIAALQRLEAEARASGVLK